MAEREVTVSGNRNRCPYCHDTLGGETFTCSACQTTHHRKCWDEQGGCTVLGCAGNTDDRSVVGEKQTSNESSGWVTTAAGRTRVIDVSDQLDRIGTEEARPKAADGRRTRLWPTAVLLVVAYSLPFWSRWLSAELQQLMAVVVIVAFAITVALAASVFARRRSGSD